MSESIGGYLARQRQLRGISLDQLEAATRIPRRSLERLESGAFDHVPDGFTRGFVRTVAEALGLEPDDTVNRMLREPAATGPGRGARLYGWAWLGLLAAALLILVPLLALNVIRAPAPNPSSSSGVRAGPDADLVLRRDPVKALAESVGAWEPGSGRSTPERSEVALGPADP